MEISAALKNDIKDIQRELTKAIQDHQNLALKLKEFPDLENQIKQDLSGIQKHIIELNDKQKVLLQQLRKEIEDNINNGQFVPVFNFNLYTIKPGQLEAKKRRRKDLSLAPKVVTCRPTHSPPSLSPSPTPSSSSSLSDDSVEYVSPFMLPVPVPKARPMLLPDVKENVYLGTVSRRDLRPPKIKRNQKPLSDEEVLKDIPVYYDPSPSPPPTDEKDLKARFMTALSLIPKEMLHEILNRKVERKRRSTATNNPNFVYNNDWEIPAWKRSRTYLSPHKLGKIEPPPKKGKGEESSEEAKLSPGGPGDKPEIKSRNSTPDSTGSNTLCFVCHAAGMLNTCKDCSVSYHLSCVSPNSSISCPCCKLKRSSPDNVSSEDSSGKEEFASKCPNVAESYSKLKEYIENHTDSDTAALYTERQNFKKELVIKNHELYNQKRGLEEKAAQLSEALLLQEDAKNNLLKEEEKLLAKIKVIVDFVTLYQKTNPKKPTETEPKSEETSDVKEDVKTEPSTKDDVDEEMKVEEVNQEEEEEGEEEKEKKYEVKEEIEEKYKPDCESTGSRKENGVICRIGLYSPETHSRDSLDNCRSSELYDSSYQTSKDSVVKEEEDLERGSRSLSKERGGGGDCGLLNEGECSASSEKVERSTESEELECKSSAQ